MVATERNHDVHAMLMRAPDASDLLDEIAGLLRPPDWHRQAACAGKDSAWWFPEYGCGRRHREGRLWALSGHR